MEITLNRSQATPMYMQISLQIKTMILHDEITDGCVLPSERMLARKLGIHRNTVVRAYNDLIDQGFVTSRQGVGYIVSYLSDDENVYSSFSKFGKNGNNGSIRNAKTFPSNNVSNIQANTSISEKKKRPKIVNWKSIIKDEYLDAEKTFDDLFTKSYGGDMISFAAGMASGDIYSREHIAAGVDRALQNSIRNAHFYTPYQGDYALRHQLALFLREKGILTNASEIQIFSETNQALDFLISMLLNPGDTVLTEEPLSPDIYRAIELAGLRQISIPLDEEGMICDNLEPLVEKYKPKLIYVSASYQDPTGRILSLERRKKLLEISYKYRIPIIEDDAVSLINFDKKTIPSIKALDRAENVIYIYSFALTLVPGLNIAFVVAPKDVIKSLSYLVSVRLISLDWIPQKMLEYFLSEGIYQDAIVRIKESYKEKMELMHRMICEADIEGFYAEMPKGGVYIWCHIPDHISIKNLSKDAIEKNVSFIPGSIFYPNGKQPSNYIRLNFSSPTQDEIIEGMNILVELVKTSMLAQ